MRRYPLSERCIEYNFGSVIDAKTNAKVLHLYQSIDRSAFGITDIIPSYTSLAVHFTSDSILFKDPSTLDEHIQKSLQKPQDNKSNHHTIEVHYNGEDIPELCQRLHLTKEELISLHTKPQYTIAMMGFRENFPYLLGLDERLQIPRRENPRSKVPKGAVAIASAQTGIYSEPSPGGWHIIGYTDFDEFSVLQPADTITFKEISC